MDTSGSGTSRISFIADVDWRYTGDAGLVIISAYPSDETQATRSYCVDPDGRTFVTWRGFVFNGGTLAAVYSDNTSNDNYEGCTFEDCVFQGGFNVNDQSINLDLNAATTPTGNGIHFDRCIFSGRTILKYDGNVTAEQNLKIDFNNCQFLFTATGSGVGDGFYWQLAASNTYSSAGIVFNNCAFIGTYYGLFIDDGASITYPITVYNCFFSAVLFVASQKKIDASKAVVKCEVGIGRGEGGLGVSVKLTLSIPDMDRAQVQDLLEAAHQVCPYSKATRGNIPVELTIE